MTTYTATAEKIIANPKDLYTCGARDMMAAILHAELREVLREYDDTSDVARAALRATHAAVEILYISNDNIISHKC